MSEKVTEPASGLWSALAAFQRELPQVAKGNQADVQTKTGRNYSYRYADLAEISPLALPLLGKHGLAWSTQPTLMGEDFVLHYSLSHSSGEAVEGVYPLPPATTPPQELGSAITYARRYALCAVTGIAPGGDDDDATAAKDARASKPKGQPRQSPIKKKEASFDWAARADRIGDVEALTELFGEAKQRGELGLPVKGGELWPATYEGTVEEYLRAWKAALQAPEPVADPDTGEVVDDGPPAALETPDSGSDGSGEARDWPTATPGGTSS